MKSIIVHAYSISDLINKIDKNITPEFQPTLAFIYTSPRYNIRKLIVELNSYPFMIFGSTTVGEIFANKEHGVKEKEESIVCMLLNINPSAISLRLLQIENVNYKSAGEDVGAWAKKQFANPAVITVTSGLNFDNDSYTQGIVSSGIDYIFGGAAGDDLILENTFVFSQDNFSSHGIIVLVLDFEKIDIIGTRAFGWTGIGKEKIVTKSDKNIVYEIDGKPAIDFYKKYLNVTADNMPQTGIEYPLEVHLRNGQIVYRAVLDIDEKRGALIFAGHVEEKAKVRLSTARGKEIISHVEKSIEELMDKNRDFKPEVGLLFPCCSRKQVLGDYAIREIDAVYKIAKVPLVGFFAYGEIGAFPNGGNAFHNETFVTALLRERG
ncbi:hypothetical protein MNB_SV-14-1680 [hydrothermal vent metagenome]|uniref:FIST C-domain domain-containing protein n=1 Tax=hydrothermal vent metagenome TaxID=652676 RepID=A0A1W1BNL0_9ZZZZ